MAQMFRGAIALKALFSIFCLFIGAQANAAIIMHQLSATRTVEYKNSGSVNTFGTSYYEALPSFDSSLGKIRKIRVSHYSEILGSYIFKNSPSHDFILYTPNIEMLISYHDINDFQLALDWSDGNTFWYRPTTPSGNFHHERSLDYTFDIDDSNRFLVDSTYGPNKLSITLMPLFEIGTSSAEIVATHQMKMSLSYIYTPAGSVPEPSTWVLLIIGFGAVGASMRKNKLKSVQLI